MLQADRGSHWRMLRALSSAKAVRHVAEDLSRIRKGKALAPVLLIRGDMSKNVPLVVADGYHRICAICYYDEDAPIACRVAGV